MSDTHPEQFEEFTEPSADRPPTDAESDAADAAARDVDVAEVGERFREMTETGADVRGEGEIEPDT